jgi:hypothetical protein
MDKRGLTSATLKSRSNKKTEYYAVYEVPGDDPAICSGVIAVLCFQFWPQESDQNETWSVRSADARFSVADGFTHTGEPTSRFLVKDLT